MWVRLPPTLPDMAKEHTLNFGVYHWDTFDNESIYLDEFPNLIEAVRFVQQRYEGRLQSNGADRVDIVNDAGKIVKQYHVC